MMSDSDSDLPTTNIFQNESTIISARGPNINTSNLTGISFRNNVLTSTMHLTRNNEWTRRAESNYDQRSISYRRETSPMSVASACDARQRNFNGSYYNRMRSNRSVYTGGGGSSVYKGRGGSPMSMRSIDSNATVSATDIATAFKTMQFNKNDMRIIKEAYNKFMKQKARRRVEKRRNLKLFLKGYRRKSGCDSGELGSNSSISSDDDQSAKTFNPVKTMSSCRSTRTDISEIRRTVRESNMFDDCTEKFRQNRDRTMAFGRTNLNTSVSSFSSKQEAPKSIPAMQNNTQQNSMTQKDRFRNGFLLPSQRFNKSVAASSIPEAAEHPHVERITQTKAKGNVIACINLQENSDDEELLSEITAIEKPISQRKRSIDSDDDICFPINKKSKVASPCKNMTRSFKNSTAIEKTMTDFEFAKPAFPARKSATAKAKEQIISKSANMKGVKLISESAAPLSHSIQIPATSKHDTPPPNRVEENEQITEDKVDQSVVSNTTDLSMRPSFIKRKLYTQKMDVTENRNKNDLLAANSPQNSIYGAIQKEKNKARKLVTSQYCLSRDIQKDDNNLLDLIHKIVPAERMNVTNQTNKTVQKPDDDDDKWDITSIISTRNIDDDVSDTFTDEETTKDNGKPQSPKVAGKTIEKLAPKTQVNQKILLEKNGTPTKTVQKYVKSFWDCESDAELEPRNKEYKENYKTDNIASTAAPNVGFRGFHSLALSNKTLSLANNTSVINSTVDSVQKLNNTNKSFKLCSHRTNKKVVEKKGNPIMVIEPQSKNQKKSKFNETLNSEKHELNAITRDLMQEKPQQETNKSQRQRKSPIKKEATTKATNAKQPKKGNNKQSHDDEKTDTNHDKPQENTKNKKQNNRQSEATRNKAQNKEPDAIKNKTQTKKKSDKNNNPENNKLDKADNNKTLTNKKSDINKIQTNKKSVTTSNKQNNKKADSVQMNTVNEIKKNNKFKASKTNNSVLTEDGFPETNSNTSIRPVRSCRNSKQNETLPSRADQSLNRTTRSRAINDKIKTARNTKKTQNNEQSNQSDLSCNIFGENNVNKKTTRLAISRLAKGADISDVSFSLTGDKGSLPKKKQGPKNNFKATIKKPAFSSPNLLNDTLNYSKHQRPVRNVLANKRYVS